MPVAIPTPARNASGLTWLAADPLGAGQTAAVGVPLPGRQIGPAVTGDSQRQIDRPGEAHLFHCLFSLAPIGGEGRGEGA